MNSRYICHIREALWKRPERGACVMVGSGFSKQAKASQSSGTLPPSWKELADRLQEALRGRHIGAGGSSTAPVTARDCARLAQQYKATFGQSALDSLLLARVPDGEPGSVHQELLRLPWADVFTTNWDTLLEKASRNVLDRTYDPVLQSADLATAVAPRIVKLHGSFPSHRPFIVTEEDYRTYPTRFAPLVNTVQQALMESVFLLVGFSGDDPNFLHWCGWVRDHLGPAAPRLYLAGLLGLNRPERLMLEERGVIPIDLESEVSRAGSREEAHREAIQWILDSLRAGKTREERWPSPVHPSPGVHLDTAGLPLPPPPATQPRKPPAAPDESSDAKPLSEQVTSLADDWRHNRHVYPGWPILPFSKHSGLSSETSTWTEAILKTTPNLDPPARLRVVRELIERTELLMDPLTPDMAKEATNAVTAVDEFLAANGLSDEQRSQSERDSVAVMLTLLTDSRHDLNQPGFDAWEQKLATLVRPGTPEFHRLHHERCLSRLWMGDFARLAALLTSWRTGDSDPMWSLRKAALLVASGDHEDAQGLALAAIHRAQRAWAHDSRVHTASRLGWALHWRRALYWTDWWHGTPDRTAHRPVATHLWPRLAPYEADARSHLEDYARQLSRAQPRVTPWTFDLKRVNRISFSNVRQYKALHAWRLMRLLELSGLPFALPGVVVLRDEVERITEALASYMRACAARLLVVSGFGTASSGDAVVSQTRLAQMSDQEVGELFEAARRARDHFLGKWTASRVADDFLLERAKSSIEIMSRCVVRHGVTRESEIFRWAINYRPAGRGLSIPFREAVVHLWERSWAAMDLDARLRAVPQVLSAPIPGDAFHGDGDPVSLLTAGSPGLKRGDVGETVWTACVTQICLGLSGNRYARRLAFVRLCWMTEEDLLGQHEEQEIARSLWGTESMEFDGLPAAPRADDWVYLILPEPKTGIAARRFQAKWIGPDATGVTSGTLDTLIRNVAAAWNPDHAREHVIHLSADEESWFWGVVEEWLRRESRERVTRGTSRGHTIPLLVALLARRRAPCSVLRRLSENAGTIPRPRHPFAEQWGSLENHYLIVAASAALADGDRGETEDGLRLGIRSPDGRESVAAWSALRWWITTSARKVSSSVRPPSPRDVRDIGIAIGSTEQSGLVGALRAACAVYESQDPGFIRAIHRPILRGLRRLRRELEYRASVGDRRRTPDLPLRRHWCARLAWAMRHAGRGDDDVVGAWIEAADADPLCLVRFVRERYGTSPPSGDPLDPTGDGDPPPPP